MTQPEPSRPAAIPEPPEVDLFRRLAKAVRDRQFDAATRHTTALRRLGWSILWRERGPR